MTSAPVPAGFRPEAMAALAAAADSAVERSGRIRIRHPEGDTVDTVDPVGRGTGGSAGAREEAIEASRLAGLIGAEAARYALLRRARNPGAAIDLDTWRRPGEANPIHRVRLAHARLAALDRYAAALGLTVTVPGDGPRPGDPASGPGVAAASDRTSPADESPPHPATALLRRTIEEFPVVLDHAANRGQPHRLTRLLERTADAVQGFLAAVRVLPTAAPDGAVPAAATSARLRLAGDARLTLATGLGVLGITAPERL